MSMLTLLAFIGVKKQVDLLVCNMCAIKKMTLLCMVNLIIYCVGLHMWLGGVAMCFYHRLGIVCKRDDDG